MYRILLKRLIDFFGSLVAIIVLLPLLIIVSLIIKFTDFGPILFKQDRIGKNKKIFKIYKFRTMKISTPKDTPTHLLGNPDKYITSIGKFLRKTSLDELPQLFNVLIGNMAIVGPRPALWNQYDLIDERDKYNANSVRPGITGLAQISGRDELEIPVKAKYDGEYVKKITMFKDIELIFKTFFSVLKSEGVKEGKSDE